MDKQIKKDYEAPAITVVTFKVEKGFAVSSGVLPTLALSEDFLESDGSQYLEERQDGGSWGWF